MKQNLIKDIVQGMLPYLNNTQNEKLQEILLYTLVNYEITENIGDFDARTKIHLQDYLNIREDELPTNTILFSSRAPIGYIAIAKNKVCTNQRFKSVIPNKNINPLFLFYLLKYNKEAIENMGSRNTFKEVSGNTMKNILVKLPVSISEQRKIAEYLVHLMIKLKKMKG